MDVVGNHERNFMAGMSNRLKNWWQQKSVVQQVPAQAVSEEVMQLFRLRREHSLLQARFTGVDDVFQSLLLEVKPEQNCLWLDEPFPQRFPAHYWVGRRIRLATCEGEFSTRFESRVSAVLPQGQAHVLVVDMPRDIMAAQRRHHYRVAINGRMPVDAVVRVPEIGNLSARVRDMSVSGVRLDIPGLHQQLEDGACLALRLGSETPMLSQLSVRYLRPCGAEQDNTAVGAMMTGLNPSQLKVVERFLVRMQRLQRQQELEGSLA
jgi:c-di-GMP-binding flagellar brake protein YcgR